VSTLPATLDSLLRRIYESPDDFDLRSIAADAAEEAGEEDLALALRYMVRNRKRPFYWKGYETVSRSGYWYDDERASKNGIDPKSDLPREIYRYLGGGEAVGEGETERSYDSTEAAEKAFYAAYTAYREAEALRRRYGD
jgi:hypothetical protein